MPTARKKSSTSTSRRSATKKSSSRARAAGPPPLSAKEQAAREAFTKALTQWMQSRKFELGVSTKDISADTKGLTEYADKLKGIFGVPDTLPIKGGADSALVFDTLVRFVRLCDLFGVRVQFNSAFLLPIIFADRVSPQEVSRRLDQIMEAAAPLAKFGIQLAGATGFVWVYPLLIYFDPKKHAEAIVTLMPKAIRHELLTKVHLEIGFVDVAGRGVQWPAKPGLLSDIGEALGHWLGTPIHLFETNDLQTVLTLANL